MESNLDLTQFLFGLSGLAITPFRISFLSSLNCNAATAFKPARLPTAFCASLKKKRGRFIFTNNMNTTGTVTGEREEGEIGKTGENFKVWLESVYLGALYEGLTAQGFDTNFLLYTKQREDFENLTEEDLQHVWSSLSINKTGLKGKFIRVAKTFSLNMQKKKKEPVKAIIIMEPEEKKEMQRLAEEIDNVKALGMKIEQVIEMLGESKEKSKQEISKNFEEMRTRLDEREASVGIMLEEVYKKKVDELTKTKLEMDDIIEQLAQTNQNCYSLLQPCDNFDKLAKRKEELLHLIRQHENIFQKSQGGIARTQPIELTAAVGFYNKNEAQLLQVLQTYGDVFRIILLPPRITDIQSIDSQTIQVFFFLKCSTLYCSLNKEWTLSFFFFFFKKFI
ncbi:hypothetical protein RFI_22470 [Reticulomyxa filosa]|uniref:Uncharacterized protein n=1 Tax=Reticulomyxa filosa TaxID=46433 RepID=X6MM51_RETFI|nr:hypothetical protein RFI_22470 [Reticulomyxa filosa]|eukprot:ETO14899.1 hypothetical protein RFI_22470 [Reticulomyxa filosa]